MNCLSCARGKNLGRKRNENKQTEKKNNKSFQIAVHDFRVASKKLNVNGSNLTIEWELLYWPIYSEWQFMAGSCGHFIINTLFWTKTACK